MKLRRSENQRMMGGGIQKYDVYISIDEKLSIWFPENLTNTNRYILII